FDTGSAAIAVRGGYAEIGATIHHARIYRINGKKPSFAMVRVFTVDLLKRRKEDLFSVQLPESSISLRTADPKIKKALKDGTAEYLGWLVAGDEIELDTTAAQFQKGQIGELLAEFPGTTRFVVAGFPTPSKFRIRPRMIAGEGYKDGTAAVTVLLLGGGWWPAVNVVVANPGFTVVRRDAIGSLKQNHENYKRISSWQVSNQ
ncbi:MAG: HNH endonuclease, partial [Arcanobacterium sp.]|nr:HNH endonuclease [Arcanobacterium sp.]